MNILIIGKFYTKFYTEGFAMHIAETLSAMGHAVRRFEPGFKEHLMKGMVGRRLDQVRGVWHGATDSVPKVRARRMTALWRTVDEGPIDVVIVCHDFLWAREVAQLKRRSGAAIAMWFPDHLANFGRGHFMNAPYDGLFFKDPYIVHVLAGRIPSPVYHLPECFNPQRHRLPQGDRIPDQYRCEITTAGNAHSWRMALYNQLSAYDVRLWGGPVPAWMSEGAAASMHQGRIVMNEEKARAFMGAKVVLNNLHYGEVWGVNVRAFEAAGIGAFQMVDWRPGLGQLFEDGRDLVSFRDIADLHEKLRFWLKHDDERQAIADSGKRRAHAEHTYALRLQLLIDSLAGRQRGFPMPVIAGWR